MCLFRCCCRLYLSSVPLTTSSKTFCKEIHSKKKPFYIKPMDFFVFALILIFGAFIRIHKPWPNSIFQQTNFFELKGMWIVLRLSCSNHQTPASFEFLITVNILMCLVWKGRFKGRVWNWDGIAYLTFPVATQIQPTPPPPPFCLGAFWLWHGFWA